jgi:hypothetical protein
MDSDKQDLRQRTKGFALRIIRLYVALPKTIVRLSPLLAWPTCVPKLTN